MAILISNYYGGTARRLADALGAKVSLADGNRRRKPTTFINFGTTSAILIKQHAGRNAWMLNAPVYVIRAVYKHETLAALQQNGVPCVDFTTDPNAAMEWLRGGRSVVCRHTTNGHGGQGIEICKWADWKAAGKPEAYLPINVKLYTKYFPKEKEVRVHVFRGEVIGYSEKRKRRGVAADTWVRSHGNGWVFATEGVEESHEAKEAAIKALDCLGLDFGAVDIGIGRDGTAVFEVNSAPGMEGKTLDAYVDSIQGVLRRG